MPGKITSKHILLLEAAGFFLLTIAIWFNEIFNLPHRLFGAPTSPTRYEEAIFESMFVLLLGLIVVATTKRYMKRISQLEKLLPICSFCKKIRKKDADPEKQESWQPVELYIGEQTGALFSHGLCPECLEKKYGMRPDGSQKMM